MSRKQDILEQLNKVQQQAVTQIDGPLMVIAGAGSGKTRVLTYRIAYMLMQGISPYRILALTFTNKAAAEMKERVFALVGDIQAKSVTMGTFHSVFYRILRVEGEKLGYTKNLTVYDTDDSKNLIKSIIKELSLDPKIYLPNYVLSRISSAKSSLLSAEEYAASPEVMEIDRHSRRPHIAEIFRHYNRRLRNADAMDFDDLLYYMNVLLRDFPEILYKYQNRYQYILVDEYQDTNYAQYIIIKKLAAAHHNICVVGDDAQSIYSFRGADIHNILSFERDYSEAKIIKLEQNYRSTQNIVNAANEIIKNNKEQIFKEIWTDNNEGKKIDIIKANSDLDEAQSIAGKIFELKMNYQYDNNQFALLYRTNSQSRALEEALRRMNIPYKIYGGLSFYKRKEIKDLFAYFRLAVNKYDEESLRRVINYPQRGIGSTTIDKVLVCAHEQNTQMWNVVCYPEQYNLDVNTSAKERLKEFAARILSYSAQVQTTDAYELARLIATTSGIIKTLKEDITEKERLENIEELLDSIKEFTEREPESSFNESTGEIITDYYPTLDRFMESVALLTDEEERESEGESKVKLMTIHSAKGLEFDVVFVTGMEESLFPSSRSMESRQEIEEERRLFYVAITRARQLLTLSYAQTRYKYGSLGLCEPSRFLSEVPKRFLNIPQKASAGMGIFAREEQSQTDSPYSPFAGKNLTASPQVPPKPPLIKNQRPIGKEASASEVLPGLKVYHSKFGYGTVESTTGEGPEKKAIITFESVGTKTLLMQYAKLVIPK
ncbi:MAG: UvrD-helicase domain-containing protein [Bacteroidales bacterium]|jgi:DNA helicase-2/ATP-dependent DNA helicase PcrA|nr:UvrD-helicase domain-containing protein [Bacteroidales bacterium]